MESHRSEITTRFSPELDLLLCAARTAPDAERMRSLAGTGIDWRAVFNLAASHIVRPLVYRSLRAVCWESVPEEIQSEWKNAYGALTGKNLFIAGELLRITAAFREAGISVAAMKGAVLAQMAYGDFTLREFSDLDLLIREEDFSKSIVLLRGLGYEPMWKQDARKVLRFLKDLGEYALTSKSLDTEIDLHWRVAHKSAALSPDSADFPSGLQPVLIAGAPVLTFAPQDLPLYLAAQGGCDQWADLRRICDVAEFLRMFPGVDWEPCMERARRLGGLRSMLTGLALASNLLGAELPESVTRRVRDADVSGLTARAIKRFQMNTESGDAMSRYLFQLNAKQGLRGKIALGYSILTDRTSKDGSWIMLPRPLWWLYGLLRPLRMSARLLRG